MFVNNFNGINCPICHSDDISINNNGYSSNTEGGIGYRQPTNNNENQITKFFYCNRCNSGWRDNDSELINIYQFKHSLHWSGLTKYIRILEGNRIEKYQLGILNIILFISKVKCTNLNILEIGCPMNSISFAFTSCSNDYSQLFSTRRKRRGIYRLILLSEIYQYLLAIIISNYGSVKRLLNLKPKSCHYFDPRRNRYSFDFEVGHRNFGWGTNCTLAGQSCFKIARIFNNKLNLIGNVDLKLKSYDISICINFLDHLDDPINKIIECCEVSKVFIFNIHSQRTAGTQHKYTFSNRLSKVVTTLSDGKIYCEELDSSKLGTDNYTTFVASDDSSGIYSDILNEFK